MLSATSRLIQSVGVGTGALLVSLVALLLGLVAAFVGLRPRRRVWAALGVAALAQAAVAVGATWSNVSETAAIRSGLPADVRWVDHARLGETTLLVAPGSDFGYGVLQLFWNTSIARVALLPGSDPIDSGANPVAVIARDGSLLGIDGMHGALLVDDSHTWVSFTRARLVRFERPRGTNSGFALWRPTAAAAPRVSIESVGTRADGWLASSGSVTVYQPSSRSRRLTLRLTLSQRAHASTIRFSLPGGSERRVEVLPGLTRTVILNVPPGSTPWAVHWQAAPWQIRSDGQFASVFRAPRPTLTTP